MIADRQTHTQTRSSQYSAPLSAGRHTHTHTHPFNGPLSGTTQLGRYQKGKTILDFTEAKDSEWQWHQLGHMQICTSLLTDNHASTSLLSFYRPDALPAAQPTASEALKALIGWKRHGTKLRHCHPMYIGLEILRLPVTLTELGRVH